MIRTKNFLYIRNYAPDRWPAGTYRMRIFVDSNGNGSWDTGNYMDRRQPERMLFVRDDLNLRGNWDLEIDVAIDP